MSRLQELREAAFLSRSELAGKAGVSERIVHYLETTDKAPLMQTRKKILKALKVPFDEHVKIFGPIKKVKKR